MIWLQAAVLALAASGQGEPMLLDFSAVWCGPCRQMSPTVERLAAAGCRIKQVDFDKNRDLVEKYGVSRLPCFIVTAGGREVGRVVGITSYDRLLGLYRQAEEAYKQVAEARAASGKTPPPMPLRSDPAGIGRPDSAGLAQNGWSPGPANAASGGGNDPDDLIAASVRIRVQDATGQSCGTGTIIDARSGWALVLTCGHIFNDSRGKGRIEVDLFGPGGPQKIEGMLVSYDSETDIGLFRIQTPGPVRAARVAPPTKRIAEGDPVISVGCNNGDAPSVCRTQISSINKYLGPANIQAGGLPVEGRSGGGLFSSDGMVVGVCNCADPQDKEGLYAAAELIRAELDRANLSFVYQDPRGVVGPGSGDIMLASATTPLPDGNPDAVASVSPAFVPEPEAENPAFAMDDLAAPKRMRRTSIHEPLLSRAEEAALDEILRRQKAGSEVVCVIRCRDNPAKSESVTLGCSAATVLQEMAAGLEAGRQQLGAEVVCVISSRDNPNAKSEIIVLDQGSSAFLRGLAGSTRANER